MNKKFAMVVLSLSLTATSMGTVFAAKYKLPNCPYTEGMTHSDVEVIQEILKKDGVYPLDEITSYFGPVTKEAVIKFQKKYGLKADGVIGEDTVAKMDSLGLLDYEEEIGIMIRNDVTAYKKGMQHPDIKIIQNALKKIGLFDYDECTDYFGPQTEEAVKQFQRRYNLKDDGVLGQDSIEKLKSLGLIKEICDVRLVVDSCDNVYKKGMTHQDIEVLQHALYNAGYYDGSEYTNYFGPKTEEAVIQFQKTNELKADGIVAKETLYKMKMLGLIKEKKDISLSSVSNTNIYKLGTTHPDVKLIQQILDCEGVYHSDEYTTYFGPQTEEAVKRFQKKYGQTPDGVVGFNTLEKLKALGYVTYRTSSGKVVQYGEYLDWFSQVRNKIIREGKVLTIQDFYTGLKFRVKVTYGTNHADVEALTYNDTSIMKKIWGGFDWERRPVLVYVDNRVIAASLSNMPHAGVDRYPANRWLSRRSAGYGQGYNLDKVKDNGMDGVIDLHFKGSLRHKDNRQDPDHQRCIKIAAGLIQ